MSHFQTTDGFMLLPDDNVIDEDANTQEAKTDEVTLATEAQEKEDDTQSNPQNEAVRLDVYGPDVAQPGEAIHYELMLENQTKTYFEKMAFINHLSEDVTITQIQTGCYRPSEDGVPTVEDIKYCLGYETQKGKKQTLGEYGAYENTRINLTEWLEAEDQVTQLIGTFEQAPPRRGLVQTLPLQLSGYIKDEAKGPVLSNRTEYFLEEQMSSSVISKQTFLIDGAVLYTTFEQITPNRYFESGDEVSFEMCIDARYSAIQNPLIAAIIPPQLLYIEDSIEVRYETFFGEVTVFPQPEVKLMYPLEGQGGTILRVAYFGESAYKLQQKDKVCIRFRTQVLENTTRDEMVIFAVLNTFQNNGIIRQGDAYYEDEKRSIAGPFIQRPIYARSQLCRLYTKEHLQETIKSMCSNVVEESVVTKTTWDNLYLEDGCETSLQDGGELTCYLEIDPTQEGSAQVIDCVQHLTYGSLLGSGYAISEEQMATELCFKEITAIKLITATEERNASQLIEVLYAYEQTRDISTYGHLQLIDTQAWQTTEPQDLNRIQAIRFRTLVGNDLRSGEKLQIRLTVILPIQMNKLQEERNAVSTLGLASTDVKTQETGVISGYVFSDEQIGGGDKKAPQGLNGRYILLAGSDGKVKEYTLTTFNAEGLPGYYAFKHQPIGDYTLSVMIDTDKEAYTQIKTNGKDEEPPTSHLINLNVSPENNALCTMRVGIGVRHTTQQILQVNKSARSILRNVIYDQMLISMKYEDILDLKE